MYTRPEVYVRVNSVTNTDLGLCVGLRQDCSLSPIRLHVYMDGIVKKSDSCGEVKNGDCTVQRLLFADYFVPLESTQNSLRKALIRFSDVCSVAGMKISTGTMKTETMCLSRQLKQFSLQVGEVPRKQSEKFKYLGISFTSDGRQNSELSMSKRSNAPAPPICGTETWAKYQGKAIHLQISLCSNSDLWP